MVYRRCLPGKRQAPIPALDADGLAKAQASPQLFDLHDGSCHTHAAIDKDVLKAASLPVAMLGFLLFAMLRHGYSILR